MGEDFNVSQSCSFFEITCQRFLNHTDTTVWKRGSVHEE
jgi:hypothetical protein